MKNKFSLKQLSGWKRAFLVLVLIFLILGFGTLGSAQSVGRSYRLSKQRSGDGMPPAITLYLSEPGHGEEGHEHRDLYVKKIYVNVGTAYTDYGRSATLRVGYGVSTTSTFYTYLDFTVNNLYREVKDDSGNVTVETTNTLFNWATVDLNSSNGYRLATYPYWRLIALNGDLLVNEVVFVANDLDGTGEDVLLNATVNTQLTNIDEDTDKVVEVASSVIDRQKIPSLAESSYFKFTPEEVAVLSTFEEIRVGKSYGADSVTHMDRIYSPLGLDILFLGPAIFGVSPFGLRFMPMLASFGVLIFAYLFVKRLTGSEKAAFLFSLLYALCGMSLSLAHLGTPLMIGVFFFTASLYFCLGFFQNGMKRAKLSAVAPVILTAVFAVAAVCTNGAFLIPVLGIAALFAAGVISQRRRLFAAISLEAESVIEEEEKMNAEDRDDSKNTDVSHEGRRKVAKLVSEANYMRTVSVAFFCAIMVIGFLLFSILAILPLYQTYVKVLDDPASPKRSIFYFIFTAFAGGFTGDNKVANLPSAFSLVYPIFNGTGSVHALTAAGVLVAIAGILSGLVGAIVSLVRYCRKEEDGSVVILLVGAVLAIITAFFAKGGLAFLLLACLFLFAFAVLPLREREGKTPKNAKVLTVVGIVLATVCFLLFAAVTFSVPLPESIVNIFI